MLLFYISGSTPTHTHTHTHTRACAHTHTHTHKKNFEARFMDFWHQRSRATQADTDVMLLSEAIKEEKKKIKHLDEMLREKGVEPVASDNTDTEDKRTNDSVTSSEIQLPHTR